MAQGIIHAKLSAKDTNHSMINSCGQFSLEIPAIPTPLFLPRVATMVEALHLALYELYSSDN